MELPTNIKVGSRWYRVWYEQAPKAHKYGRISYALRTITVYDRKLNGAPHKPAEVRDTFWHEITHAVLYEMGDDLHRNEEFVTKFSGMLSKAIDSARFNHGQ